MAIKAENIAFSGKVDYIEINEGLPGETVDSSHDFTAEKAEDLKQYIPDLVIEGHPQSMFLLLSRLSTRAQNWTSRVYGLEVENYGVLLQHVYEHNGVPVSQMVPIPGGKIVRDEKGLKVVVPTNESFCGAIK